MKKKEFLLIRPNKCKLNLYCLSLSFGHNIISFSSTANNRGFYFTDDMRIDEHVQDICRKVYIDMRRISSIRHLLSFDPTKILLSAFVLQKLHYCNSLFNGSPMYMLERLQKVKNSAARQVFQCRKQSHISPIIMSLHWLPIKACIEYKLSVISHSFTMACLLFTCLIYSQSTHPKEIYAPLLTMEFYVSLSCEQRHLGIAQFILQPPQYGILELLNSDILILSRNLGQH